MIFIIIIFNPFRRKIKILGGKGKMKEKETLIFKFMIVKNVKIFLDISFIVKYLDITTLDDFKWKGLEELKLFIYKDQNGMF